MTRRLLAATAVAAFLLGVATTASAVPLPAGGAPVHRLATAQAEGPVSAAEYRTWWQGKVDAATEALAGQPVLAASRSADTGQDTAVYYDPATGALAGRADGRQVRCTSADTCWVKAAALGDRAWHPVPAGTIAVKPLTMPPPFAAGDATYAIDGGTGMITSGAPRGPIVTTTITRFAADGLDHASNNALVAFGGAIAVTDAHREHRAAARSVTAPSKTGAAVRIPAVVIELLSAR